MRKTLFALILALFTASAAHAVSAPTGLYAGPVSANSANLYWADDATVNQWYIYLNGTLRYQPNRSDTGVSGTARSYLMHNLPVQTSIVISMKALVAGAPLSAMSAAITITSSTVPVNYVLNPPGVPILVSFTSGGGAASAVSVISSVLPAGGSTSALQTSGNSTLTTINSNLSNVTVNAHAVTQGGPWTVSGSVTTNPSGAYQGVSVFSGVAGLTVTASQGSPWTVSGSVGVTSGVAGLTVTASQGGPFTVSGSVSVTNLNGITVNAHAVTQGGPWTVSGSVGVTSGVGGISTTASQGGPWTISGSVGVTSGVGGISTTASQGGPWTVSGSVGVTSGVGGISVTASQGGPFTVSGSVSVTNLNGITVNAHAVTQGGPWTVSGSVGVTSGVGGISTTASQGGPWTVSGSVGVTSGVGGISVTASQGGPWTVSGSVGVTSGVGGISVTASQGGPWTVSGSVSVTNLNGITVNAHAVTQGGPWTVSGSVSTAGNVSVTAGTATIGNIGVTNTVNVVNLAGTATIGNVGVTSTVSILGTAGTATIGNVGITNTVNVVNLAGTAYMGAVGVSGSVAVVNAAGTSFMGSVGISTTASVQGDIASGVADSGNPVKVGGVAKTALPTAVADGQRVNGTFDKSGRRLMRMSPRERVFSATLGITYVAEVTVLAAGGASVFRDLTAIMISNSGTNNNTVTIRDSLAGTTRFVFEVASQGGGAVSNFTVPVPQTTANNVWSVQLTNSPTGGTVRVNLVASEDN